MRITYRLTAFLLSLITIFAFSYPRTSLSEPGEAEATESGTEIRDKYVSDDGIVHLQREMDIVDLIKAVSEINDEVYVIEDDIKPKEVSIITPEAGMQKDEVLRLFEIILSMNGLTIVKRHGINKVIYISDMAQETTPVESGN